MSSRSEVPSLGDWKARPFRWCRKVARASWASKVREAASVASESLYQLIDNLAWPMAVMVVAVCFRNQLGPVFSRIGSLKYRDVEVRFLGDQLGAAEALAGTTQRTQSNVPAPADSRRDRLERLATINPTAAIISAWWELDGARGSEHEPIDPTRPSLFNHLRTIADSVLASRRPAPTLNQARRFNTLVLDLLGQNSSPGPIP
jgi:hypothetical protein